MSLLSQFQDIENKITKANKWCGHIIDNDLVSKITDGLLWSSNTMYNGGNLVSTGIPQSYIKSAYTIFVSIKPTAWNNYRGVVGEHGGYNQGIVGMQYENGAIKWAHVGNSSWLECNNQVSTLNTMHNICFTFSNNTLKGYKNGILFGTKTNYNDINPLGSIVLGRAYNSYDRYVSGTFGICYIYNRALTDLERLQMVKYIEQVQERYNSIRRYILNVFIYTI